jgi:hypothetical protein
MMERRIVASLNGHDYDASFTQNPNEVVLVWRGNPPPDGGFSEPVPGVYRKFVELNQLDRMYESEWRFTYQGEPFVVSVEGDGYLVGDYVGDSESRARELGLDITEKLVARGRVPREAAEDLREVRRQIWPVGDIES